jgi:glycerol uptake facilitator protein
MTKDEETVRGSFCTGPAIRNYKNNFFSELIGTFILVFAIFFIAKPNLEIEGEVVNFGIGALDALPVGIVVWVIGMTLGGTTGFAINPARDFGPRLMYSFLPRKNKEPDWSYSWIPVLGPFTGALLAGLLFNFLI